LVILLGIRPEIKVALMGTGGRFPRAAHLEQQNGAETPYDDWDEYLSQIHWSWRELCEKLQAETDGLTYEALPGYHQFLYQLAQMSPVPYFPDGPISIQPEILRHKKEELKRFNFSLRVDNRLLYKPTLLPSGALTSQDELKMGDNYLIRQIQFNDVLADGTHLRYHGYLYWQKAENKPTPLHGIQIYICNVGIGLYDETLLNYSKVERNSRTGQISGEIYVEEGLEQALNVDRRSFRETDLHYVTLQQQIWKEIGVIWQQSASADKRRKQIESATSLKQHVATLEQLLSVATNGKMALAVASDQTAQPMEISKQKLVFNLESNKWTGTQNERLLGQKILLTMRAALATGASAQDTLGLVEDLLLK